MATTQTTLDQETDRLAEQMIHNRLQERDNQTKEVHIRMFLRDCPPETPVSELGRLLKTYREEFDVESR